MRFNHVGVISEITTMPGCSQICIFHNVFVKPEARNKGIGSRAHYERLCEARALGYQMALCTVISSNIAQKKILSKAGWKYHQFFNSEKTENPVELWSILL